MISMSHISVSFQEIHRSFFILISVAYFLQDISHICFTYFTHLFQKWFWFQRFPWLRLQSPEVSRPRVAKTATDLARDLQKSEFRSPRIRILAILQGIRNPRPILQNLVTWSPGHLVQQSFWNVGLVTCLNHCNGARKFPTIKYIKLH